MEVRGEVREALLAGAESELRRLLKAAGVRTLTEQAVERATEGMITVTEAYRTCYFGGGVDE
ncbi:MAG: hypothetical protein HY646_17950 [Acidobacteria bacterium]|nr:hypothetical protein [Acidobacteriota bacterium]